VMTDADNTGLAAEAWFGDPGLPRSDWLRKAVNTRESPTAALRAALGLLGVERGPSASAFRNGCLALRATAGLRTLRDKSNRPGAAGSGGGTNGR
jgi:hypothetical protein